MAVVRFWLAQAVCPDSRGALSVVRLAVLIAVLAALPFAFAAGVLAQSESGDSSTATVEVRVWQDVGDELDIYISARPAGGSWRTLGTIPLPLDDGVSSSGRFRYGDISVDVPLPGQDAPATVEVRVWQDVGDIASIYISARPAGGSWRTLGTILLPLDDGVSSSGRFRYGDISLDVPLPEPTPPPVARTTFTGAIGELEYSIGLAEGWIETAPNIYGRSSPQSGIRVAPTGEPMGRTLREQAEAIRGRLEQEIAARWPSYLLYEFTSMDEVTVEGQVFYDLRYRAQGQPELCVVSYVERIAVMEAWHGLTSGLRAGIWLCEEDVEAHDAARQATLDTLRVTATEVESTAGTLGELEYSIEFTDAWIPSTPHTFNRSAHWSVLAVRPTGGPAGGTLREQAESTRDHLELEIATLYPSHSLFEFTSLEEVTGSDQASYELRYRLQTGPEFCVLSVVERILAAEAWHGFTSPGLRAISWLCEGDVERFGAVTQAMLDTIKVSTAPSDYYTQAQLASGIVIKAPASVSADALTAAGAVIDWMLESARQGVVQCMADVGASLAITPADEFVTNLPEFAFLSGGADFTGRTYDSFDIRGLGAVRGRPVTATAEEVLLGDTRNLNITVHEFAHSIENLCFTPADTEKWEQFYADAREDNLYPGTHAMADLNEFFAVFSSAYFGVTDELGPRSTSRGMIQTRFPDIFESLEDIYGSPGPPPEE